MTPRPICLVLLRQEVLRAASLACAKTGNRIAARIAMIAITTSSSIRVNANVLGLLNITFYLSPPIKEASIDSNDTDIGMKPKPVMRYGNSEILVLATSPADAVLD